MALFGNLGQYDPEEDDWTEYYEQMENFFFANDITEDVKKRAIFLSSCGSKMYSLIRSLLTPSKPTEQTFEETVEVIKAHQSPKRSVIMERYKFNKRDRKIDETVSQYIAALRKICQHCDYGEIYQEMIRDRLICGIGNDRIQQKLLSESTLTLDGAVKIATSMEAAMRNFSNKSTKQELPESSGHSKMNLGYVQNITCFRCGGRYTDDEFGGFKDRVCFYCHRKGHVAKILIPNQEIKEENVQRPQRVKKAKDINTSHDNEETVEQRPHRDRKIPAYLEDYA